MLSEGNLELGTQVHCSVVKVGLENHVSVSNVVMSMYHKQGGNIDKVKRVFEDMRERNVISWTTMISADTENGISLFNRMRLDDVLPNEVTFVALINVVSDEQLPREGRMMHGMCFMSGVAAQLNVSNSLVTMYAKLGFIEESSKIFRSIEHKEIISWNAMVSGYAHNGLSKPVYVWEHPQCNFLYSDSAIELWPAVPLRIVKSGLNTDKFVSGALIDLYAKRGGIDDSQKVFDETTQRSLITWTAIISAYAKHGSYENVMSLFEDMVKSGVRPDHITFLAVLQACGCKGMVDMGWYVFNSMVYKHMVEPWLEHYACMVDMLGRAGRLAEAEEFSKRMPEGPGVSALQSLLGACRVYGKAEMGERVLRVYGNAEMGERVAKVLMDMEPMESGAYVLMLNMYAEKGEWENVAKIRRGMRNRGVKKEIGFSWVDVGAKDSVRMHKFSSDDKTHPRSEEIYRMAECLGFDMKNQEESQPVV
ncbi:putative tetratricopeptide-like helical domain superfamily [Dioscorea sansibarensis]